MGSPPGVLNAPGGGACQVPKGELSRDDLRSSENRGFRKHADRLDSAQWRARVFAVASFRGSPRDVRLARCPEQVFAPPSELMQVISRPELHESSRGGGCGGHGGCWAATGLLHPDRRRGLGASRLLLRASRRQSSRRCWLPLRSSFSGLQSLPSFFLTSSRACPRGHANFC